MYIMHMYIMYITYMYILGPKVYLRWGISNLGQVMGSETAGGSRSLRHLL